MRIADCGLRNTPFGPASRRAQSPSCRARLDYSAIRIPHSAILLFLFLSGCDGWKQADAQFGLLLTPFVDTVNIEGRPLIRLQGRHAVAYVDLVGARVVDYRLQRRPIQFWEPSPKDEAGVVRKLREFPAGPNVLDAPGWVTRSDPPSAERDERTAWQVDSSSRRLVLLTDAHEGLRWRKEFYIHESGVLDIAVWLDNVSGRDMTIGAQSVVHSSVPPITDGRTEHRRRDNHWFSRRLMESPDSTPSFTFAPRLVPNGRSISWQERWWVRPAEADDAAPPADPPRLDDPPPFSRTGEPY